MPDLEQVLREGIALASSDAAEARRRFRTVTVSDPRSELGWFWLAYTAEGRPEAIGCLERVVEINPANDRARTQLCRFRFDEAIAANSAGDRSRARDLLGKVVLDEPSNPNAWLWLATVRDEPAKMLEALDRVLALRPGHEVAKAWRAQVEKRLAGTRPSKRPEVEPQPPPSAVKVILAVDDSPTVRRIVAMTLEKRGYRVVTAADGSQALALLREQRPSLIFLDVTMPHINGLQLCRVIKGDASMRQIPIVMLTGKDGLIDKARGKIAGAAEYLTKPFEPGTLVRTVEHLLGT